MEGDSLINSKLYAFTFKNWKTPKDLLDESHYEEILHMLRKHGSILDLVYEDKNKQGLKCRLHIHGIIDFQSIPRLTTLIPKGYSVKFDKIYNLEQFQRYIHKNS